MQQQHRTAKYKWNKTEDNFARTDDCFFSFFLYFRCTITNVRFLIGNVGKCANVLQGKECVVRAASSKRRLWLYVCVRLCLGVYVCSVSQAYTTPTITQTHTHTQKKCVVKA